LLLSHVQLSCVHPNASGGMIMRSYSESQAFETLPSEAADDRRTTLRNIWEEAQKPGQSFRPWYRMRPAPEFRDLVSMVVLIVILGLSVYIASSFALNLIFG
jgi:hypothetical protein